MMRGMAGQYALILAGGSGTRFWPLSRNERPKQLLDLFGEGTLLAQTIQRLEGLIPKENIFILTNELQKEGVIAEAEGIPTENIFAEPAKRDTAPAVALGVGLIAARDPEASMVVLPADQLINDVASFQEVIKDALTIAENEESLITVGIKPTWACSSYGYIERGEVAQIKGVRLKNPAYKVKRFREKPATELAERFLEQGGFSWNAGMFIWSVPTVMKELGEHSPGLHSFVEKVRDADDQEKVVNDVFQCLHPTSIDYALMETANSVLNIEANFDWDDIGSWISVSSYLSCSGSGKGNKTNREITEIDSESNIVYNSRENSHIALLGVDDLIIVQTEDGLLVANRHQADAIKKLVKKLPKELQ